MWRERLAPYCHAQRCRSDEGAIKSTTKSMVVHTCRCYQLGYGGDTDSRTGDIGSSSTRDAGDRRSMRGSMFPESSIAPAVHCKSSCLLYHPIPYTPSLHNGRRFSSQHGSSLYLSQTGLEARGKANPQDLHRQTEAVHR